MMHGFGCGWERLIGIFFQPLPIPFCLFFGFRGVGGQGKEGGHDPCAAGKSTAHLTRGGIGQAKFSAIPNPACPSPAIANASSFETTGYHAIITIALVDFSADYRFNLREILVGYNNQLGSVVVDGLDTVGLYQHMPAA